ncbi:MAG TPA: NAD(P)H-binding protein [Nocardioides sp.]|nr:NAD(P)H-binding protein [Nocardioides sp.]
MTVTHPSRFLVFGAGGHIGGPAAEHLAARLSDAHIRLVTSRPTQVEALRERHPKAEVCVANYLDAADMRAAFEGVEAAFVVTPDFLDETTAMGNIVGAIEHTGSLVRLIRLIGDPPGLREESEVETEMSGYDAGTAVQHLRARKVLSSSNAPVVYMNVAAWFMQDFATFLLPPILRRRTLVMPYDRLMNYIDTRDIGRGPPSSCSIPPAPRSAVPTTCTTGSTPTRSARLPP